MSRSTTAPVQGQYKVGQVMAMNQTAGISYLPSTPDRAHRGGAADLLDAADQPDAAAGHRFVLDVGVQLAEHHQEPDDHPDQHHQLYSGGLVATWAVRASAGR